MSNEQQEREAFFRHITSGAFIPEQPEELIEQVISFNYAAWRAWKARTIIAAHEAAKQTPEGFKLAPIEPTPEMAASAQRWVAAGVEAVYRAMLAAAP